MSVFTDESGHELGGAGHVERRGRDSGAAVDEVEAIVRQHSRFVFGVAWSVLRNREDAEDAAQETIPACRDASRSK